MIKDSDQSSLSALTRERASQDRQWARVFSEETTIESLMVTYPSIWGEVKDSVASAIKAYNPEELNELLLKADRTARHWSDQVRASKGLVQKNRILTKAIPQVVRSRMIHLAVKKVLTSKVGGDSSQVTQSSRDRWLCNQIIYLRYKNCKPVNASVMHLLWRLVKDKGAAIGAAKRIGMYCVYTNRLLSCLVPKLRERVVVEVAAGNGILSLLLSKQGVPCIATDDRSWGHAVRYGKHVEDLDAQAARIKYKPSVVICSWPPPDNAFEAGIFADQNVTDYIVIGSKHQFATGNRAVYKNQSAFDVEVLANPDNLVGPPGIDGEVLWFTRRTR